MSTNTTLLSPLGTPATDSVLHTPQTTAWDVIEHLSDFFGAEATGQAPRVVRRSLQAALRELTNAHNWTYYYQHGRLHTNGPYDTGTVEFDYTGGSYERLLTLTDGEFPDWAGQGFVRIGEIIYRVDRRIGDTSLTLDANLTPTVDLDATAYTLFRDSYPMPADFVASDEGLAEFAWGGMTYVHASEWIRVHRFIASFSNTPQFFTFTGHPSMPGRLALRMFPYPDADRTIDFLYKRRPRIVVLDKYEAGTITVTPGPTGTQVVAGTGTVWDSTLVGSTLRISIDGARYPTAFEGNNPFAEERTVRAVSSATQLLVDEAITTSYSGVKYRLSDPIDVEQGAMLDAYFRCTEKHAGILRRGKDRKELDDAYIEALIFAKEADSRSFQTRVAGTHRGYRQRLADMPSAPDQS